MIGIHREILRSERGELSTKLIGSIDVAFAPKTRWLPPDEPVSTCGGGRVQQDDL
jgi:hypothetical protein